MAKTLAGVEYLNCDKEQEHQLVPLEQSSAGVDEDGERDAVQ